MPPFLPNIHITLIFLLWSFTPSNTQPNIVFLLLDDLGFSDIGYNGATYPTPLFDYWASNGAIKFHRHYSEATCTPSRTALYTGRYAFKSGLNRNVDQEDHYTFDPSLKLYPEVLKEAGYNTFIAGKWHVGYKYASVVPAARGFDEGLYAHHFRYPIPRRAGFALSQYDRRFPTAFTDVLLQRTTLFTNTNNNMPHWDLWRIENGEEQATLIGDVTYSEELYTDHILTYLEKQTADTPFFVHFNLVTPHAPIAEPTELSDTSGLSYDICNIASLPANKQLFCRAVLYAQDRIDRIIRTIKRLRLYANTVFIVVSDNGGDPEQATGIAEGQNLPLRGAKTGIHEGGIRTPAFMFGGYIEDLLASMGISSLSECVYNKLVHISDWYYILLELAMVSQRDQDRDNDHRLDIWDDILCECNPSCDSSTDSSRERTEIISMRVCGDEDSYATDRYPAKYFFASYIIQWPWKMVINSSSTVSDDCPNGNTQDWSDRSSYYGYNGYLTSYPNQQFYTTWYRPQIDAGRYHLYGSQCYDEMQIRQRDNIDNPSFQYDQVMLFNLETDPIEACNVYDDNKALCDTLFDRLEEKSLEYNVIQNRPESVGAMWAKVKSYDCSTGYAFMIPWEGAGEGRCGPPMDTVHSINNRECVAIWRELNQRKSLCPNI